MEGKGEGKGRGGEGKATLAPSFQREGGGEKEEEGTHMRVRAAQTCLPINSEGRGVRGRHRITNLTLIFTHPLKQPRHSTSR